jgi:hypothetical protein
MDESKLKRVQEWPTPTSVTEIRRFLGFTGYYRYFIQSYSAIARPLLALTHKGTPWHWTETQQTAFEELRDKMCSKPVLQQPNFNKKFYIQTDTSTHGVGAILLQEGGSDPETEPEIDTELKIDTNTKSKARKPKLHPIAYYSATFTPTKRNYDIYERELLAIIKALAHWRHYLVWTKEPFKIQTDHANLLYWKSARKLNGRTARWHGFLQDYSYEIEHVPGKLHTAADALSRPTNHKEEEEESTIMIPEKAFIKVADKDSSGSLEERIIQSQQQHQLIMKAWEARSQINHQQTIDGPMWKTTDTLKLAIPPDPELFREILKEWHDLPTAGHPGRDEMVRRITNQYHWPGTRKWIEAYVKGCATCQQNKNLTHKVHTPLYRITVPSQAQPFEQIAMDLITGLPKSDNYDAILTIVDHGCSRAALFLPCNATITGPEIAQLYLNHIYKWFGLPRRIISDRDPRFTSHFGKALSKELDIS